MLTADPRLRVLVPSMPLLLVLLQPLGTPPPLMPLLLLLLLLLLHPSIQLVQRD
jgi:hypothetical protein